MSGQHRQHNPETLFSLEILLEFIRLDRRCEVSDVLALAIRLLDFPTLIIYQPQRAVKRSAQDDREYTFHKGKCCLFKMNPHLLHIHLASTPLYAMVLDVEQEMPILVGSSLISLAKAMDKIERHASRPSSHIEKELVSICSLTGEKIGLMSLSYKLLCMGESLLPHITERGGLVSEGQRAQERVEEGHKSVRSFLDCEAKCPPTADKSGFDTNAPNDRENAKISSNQNDGGDAHADYVDNVERSKSRTETAFEEETNIFCPPHLYYISSAEEGGRKEVVDYKLLNHCIDAFPFDESCSDEEEDKYEMPQKIQAEASELTPNILAETIRKLPVLSALLTELSQLSGHTTNHPHPFCMHCFASAEPTTGHGNTQKQPLHKSKNRSPPNLTLRHSPRNCSTPVNHSVKIRNKPVQSLKESKNSSQTKKLVYGTTKTFNMRVQRASLLKAKHRECEKMLQQRREPSLAKGKAKSSHETANSRKTKICSCPNENTETVIQSATVNSAQREKSRQEKVQGKQDRNVLMSDKPSLSELDLKRVHIPSVGSDSVPQSKDEKHHHSESDQSQPHSDRHRERVENTASSRCDSARSPSNSSRDGSEEAYYADDFNSLAPSDAFSPEPLSSPETFRTQTPRSPNHSDVCGSDFGSGDVQRRVVLPAPVKDDGSLQRALRGTYVIRPRLHMSALSFSDDDDSQRSSSSQTTHSRKQVMASQSGTETSKATTGQSDESAEDGGSAGELTAESISSLEAREEKELEDEVGSLDLRKEYQLISQLVANKLPGYTM